MKPKKQTVKKATSPCCSPNKSCSAPKKQAVRHELDQLLNDKARTSLIKDYLKLASIKDGKRFFKFPKYTPNKDKALSLLEEVFDLKSADIKALNTFY